MSDHRKITSSLSSSLILLVKYSRVYTRCSPRFSLFVGNEVDDERNTERYVNPMTDGGRLEGPITFFVRGKKRIYRLLKENYCV